MPHAGDNGNPLGRGQWQVALGEGGLVSLGICQELVGDGHGKRKEEN